MKIPKKYQNTDYIFNKEKILINALTKEKVVKNSKTAGKERKIKISGQDIWTGINCHLRSKMAKDLKHFFYDAIKHIDFIGEENYPIGVYMEFYDKIEDCADIDNLQFIYRKTLHDALSGNVEFVKNKDGKFIPDRENYPAKIKDDNLYVIRKMETEFFPIDEEEEPKLIIKLYKL
jgi:hypothetical protein